jgi:hypothetical protein
MEAWVLLTPIAKVPSRAQQVVRLLKSVSGTIGLLGTVRS